MQPNLESHTNGLGASNIYLAIEEIPEIDSGISTCNSATTLFTTI